MGKGGGTQTQTQTQQQQYAPYINDAWQDIVGAGFNMNEPFMRTPGFATAAMTPDQMVAMDQIRQGSWEANNGGWQTTDAGEAVMGNVQDIATNGIGDAAQITGAEIKGMMNPYLDTVGKATLGSMRDEYQNADAGLAAKYASRAAFGGSGEAISRGQLAGDYSENVGKAIAGIYGGGYDNAAGLARENVGLRQRTAETNAGLGMRGASLLDDLDTARQTRALRGSGALLQSGNQQQGYAQTVLDTPLRALERYARLVPNVQDSYSTGTSTAPDNSPGLFNTLLGAGLSIGGMGVSGGGTLLGNALSGFMSDEDEKTNIEEIGIDPETGLMMYSYDYISDVEEAERNGAPMPPKRVGPMAQDIEEKAPGSTKRIGGKLTVNPMLTV